MQENKLHWGVSVCGGAERLHEALRRPWRASARLRPPPCHTAFSHASFLPILKCVDYNDAINKAMQEN